MEGAGRERDCPGQETPFLVVKRHAHPCKSPIQKSIYCGKREGRLNALGGPGQGWKDIVIDIMKYAMYRGG